MPWTARDAYRHTKKASTPEAQSQWAAVANRALESSGDEAAAIRQANAAVGNTQMKPKSRPKGGAKAPHEPKPDVETAAAKKPYV